LFQFSTIGELSKYLEIELMNETEDDDNTVFEQIIM
jgi:hypothetical protein